MAQKKTESSEKTNIRRIKATDETPQPKKKVASKKTKTSPKAEKNREEIIIDAPTKNPFVALGRYFKGAWVELKQVRWPTRSATWSMTLAVLLFTAMFVVLILLLDAGFKWLFEQLLR